ncbi:hypothetical protein ACLX1H_010346 [Fusarium chlamydosporum]
MVRFSPVAVLALVPLAQARFDWLYARDTIAQCPPCTMEGDSRDCSHTVTVTEPAIPCETVTVTERGEPGKTVTVTQNYQRPETKVVYISQGETLNLPKETVTVTASGKVVTVTNTESSEHVGTKQTNVYPSPEISNDEGYHPGPKTVTVSNVRPAPSAGSPGYDGAAVTKVVGDGNDVKYPSDAHTVTVIDDGKVKTLTYTDGNYRTVLKTVTQGNGKKKVVTATGNGDYEVAKTVTLDDGEKIIETVTAENKNNYVITETVHQDGKYHTVIIKPEPTVSTITKDNGDYVTTSVENPHRYTLTAPVRYGSPSPTEDDCETVTRTATYTGKPEVEIIVYDPESGDSTCTKEDGQPCHSGYGNDRTGDDGKGQHDGGSDGKYEVPTYAKGQDNSDGSNSNLPVYTKIRTSGNGDSYTE